MSINKTWIDCLDEVMRGDRSIVSTPRGKKIREIIGNTVRFDMSEPIITLAQRKVNYKFAFGEAKWIVSGSNRLSDITKYMKRYADFSDDGVTLSGAYGPKFVDQISWAARQIATDPDTRQAVISLWREKPGPSKDIPCTLSLQFLLRDGRLNTVVNMRSNDLFHGFTYDSFTFTMMAKVIQEILFAKYGVEVNLGVLTLNQGSAHVYEEHWDSALDIIRNRPKELDQSWLSSSAASMRWNVPWGKGYENLIEVLDALSQEFSKS